MSGLPAVVTILGLGTGTLSSSAVFPASMTTNGAATTLGFSLVQIASAVLSAAIVPVPSGGTNTSTLTVDGVLFGNGTSTIGITAAGGTSLPLLGQGAGNAPVFGVLPVIGGGTNTAILTAFGVMFGNGTSTVGITAAGTSGLPLVGNGSALAPSFGVAAVPGGGTNTSTLTANAVLYGNGTSTVGLLTAGATGQMLMGQGTSAAPVMQYPGYTLLNILTASNVTAVQDTTSINATFNNYLFHTYSMLPSNSAAAWQMLLQSGGVFQTTLYSNIAGGGTTYIDFTQAILIGTTATAGGFSGPCWLSNVNSATTIKTFRSLFLAISTAGVINNVGPSAVWTAAATATGFKLQVTTGTFSGTIAVYGLRAS